MGGFQGQRFQDEHIERALDEVTWLLRHRISLPLGYQEENTLLLLVVNGRKPEQATARLEGEFELLVTHGGRDFDADSARCQYL